MMRSRSVCIKLVFTVAVLLAPNAQAQSACEQVVKSCFAENGLQRANCFYTAAKDKDCTKTELGKLTYRRWSLSSNTTISGDTPPGLLGPSMYDDACLVNCDNRWLSHLLAETLNAGVIKQLDACFNECTKGSALEILRP